MIKRVTRSLCACVLSLTTVVYGSAQADPIADLQQTLTAAQMRQDIDAWHQWLHDTHPDPSIRIADMDMFKQRLAGIENSFDGPQTTLQFLDGITPLNSLFNDGHMSLMVPSQGKLVRALMDQEGGLFPFEVTVSDGQLFIASQLGGAATEHHGKQLSHINGVAADSIYTTLMARVYGDTVRHREAILAQKFAHYYWLFIAQTNTFDVQFQDGNTTTFEGLSTLPVALQNEGFDELFTFEVLDDHQALLTINLFWWEDKDRFYAFTESVFKQLKQQGIEHLIIDVRQNPGGDDDTWKQGILTYIADKPYRHTSRYTKKIIAKYMDEGEVLGDVVSEDYDAFDTPQPDHPLHFDGDVTVVIGALTYSSALVFANTVQDFGFAQIAGEPSGGYSWQTGGIQFFTLPNSGLKAVAPRFYLHRPSGEGKGQQVMPDVELRDDPRTPRNLIEQLARRYNDRATTAVSP
ncbi:hypothetical protein LJ739_17280 [Aestuariibacter halophilus]|uniref:Tail specific protease domain-containing protein n=1 Tax=Fluctibacter halophilus TaxID=226011 RepID=A0ABS8GBP7_9ALTE|nr:S41 family peptidase [Aestuariibacter halophilus]MCC2618010.1 hypothetical protein [Aestuariibacter halophilus]